jgi:uncharacterized protein YbjT (DUF2867 family)
MPYPAARVDCIAPEDMGPVCGGSLVRGREGRVGGGGATGSEVVYLAGPQLVSHGEVVEMVGRALGKKLKVESFASDEEAVQLIVRDVGMPEAGARQVVNNYREIVGGKDIFDEATYEEAVANAETYGGRPAMPIQKGVEDNKDKFV